MTTATAPTIKFTNLPKGELNETLLQQAIEMAKEFHDIGQSEFTQQYHAGKRVELFIEHLRRDKLGATFVEGEMIEDMTLVDVFDELNTLHISASNSMYDANQASRNWDYDDEEIMEDSGHPDELEYEGKETFIRIEEMAGELKKFLQHDE